MRIAGISRRWRLGLIHCAVLAFDSSDAEAAMPKHPSGSAKTGALGSAVQARAGGAAVPFNASSAICDRADSRTAVHVIEHVLRPRIVAAGYTVPEGCLLDAARDMFALQEAHKKLVRKSVWRCKFDDKVRQRRLCAELKRCRSGAAQHWRPDVTHNDRDA